MIAPAPAVVERSDDGAISVEERRIGGHRYETLVVRRDGRRYRFADVRVSQGRGYYFNDDDYNYPHNFVVSPDGNWLFVTRKCLHKVDIGYLFHFDGHCFVRVRPQGLRFDEAVLRFFGRTLHFPVPTLESGARVIRFGRWARNGGGFVFKIDESTDYEKETGTREIMGYYSFRSGRFGLLKLSRV